MSLETLDVIALVIGAVIFSLDIYKRLCYKRIVERRLGLRKKHRKWLSS